MSLVELTNIVKTYPAGEGRQTVLNGLDLVLDAGEFTVVAGPSGSGKSTLLNIIGAIDTPDSGGAKIAGVDVAGLSDAKAARLRNETIGFIFQAFHLIPVLSAWENVAWPLFLLGRTYGQRKARALELLELVELSDHARKIPAKLSGGQRQRVAIARALACNPKLVLADEPTANLDQKTALSIMDLLARMNKEEKTAFIFSTHDPRVMQFSNRQFMLEDGKLIEESSLLKDKGTMKDKEAYV